MDAGVSRSNKTQGQQSDAQPDDKNRLSNTAGKNGTSHGVGYGNDSDRQESVTRSGINTRNLQITDEAGQIRQTGLTAEETRAKVSTGTTTESAQTDAGSLHNRFDKEQVQRELDTQTEVTQTFSHTRQQIWSAAATKAQAHREEAENLTRSANVAEKNGDHATAAQLRKEAESERQQAKRWQWAGVAVNMVGAGLSAPTQSSAGIAANAAAPAVSYRIGQEFKRRNAEGSLGHLLAHATLGGLTAAAGGNDPLAGALSSGGAEAAAGYISGLFGQTDGSRLSAEQKETVTAITSLLGTAAGAALGSTPADVAQGSLNARNSVENNSVVNLSKNGGSYSDDKTNRFNLYQRLVKDGIISLEDVPNEIFETLAKSWTTYEEENGVIIKNPDAAFFRNLFQRQIADGNVINDQEYLSNIPQDVDLGKYIKPGSFTLDRTNVAYKFAQGGLSTMTTSEIEDLASQMKRYGRYRISLGDKVNSSNQALMFGLLKIGINNHGIKDTPNTDEDRQKAINEVRNAYNIIRTDDSKIAEARQFFQTLNNVTTSTWSGISYEICNISGGNTAECSKVANTTAIVDGAVSSISLGRSIAMPNRLIPAPIQAKNNSVLSNRPNVLPNAAPVQKPSGNNTTVGAVIVPQNRNPTTAVLPNSRVTTGNSSKPLTPQITVKPTANNTAGHKPPAVVQTPTAAAPVQRQPGSSANAQSPVRYKPVHSNHVYDERFRTIAADREGQKVIAAMNGVVTSKRSPTIQIALHKNGTVSVGLSGDITNLRTQQHIAATQRALDTKYGAGKYKVSAQTLDESHGLHQPKNDGHPNTNKIGVCAEPKCAAAARDNPSPMTGFAIMWRGRGDNPYPINPADAKARGLSPNQMYMCPTCEPNRPRYEQIMNNRMKR